MGLAVGRDIDYVRVTTRDGEQLILAASLVEDLFRRHDSEIAEVTPVAVEDLVGLRYEPLFDYFAGHAEEGAFRV